ncbi:tetratricopeptide repeat protein [Priestia megaterium]|uniref:hypothetical protein n=1 Tax=Priestia megaterium TaxID=1404 RepID=UPI002D80D853|nr:hypothetical protein [Priestia megaterium]MEB4887672.1 hypothetical protein [Priestia megaterium]
MSKYDEIDFEEIALEMQKQVEQGLHNVKLRNELAIVFMETNEYEEAFDIVEDLLKNKPDHYFPYNLMGEMYIKEEKYEEAINVLKEGINLTPSLENLSNLELCYYKKGMLPEAAECFHKAHRLRSCNNYGLFPLLSYGICLAQLGRKSEAREVAKELLFLSEKEKEAHICLQVE